MNNPTSNSELPTLEDIADLLRHNTEAGKRQVVLDFVLEQRREAALIAIGEDYEIKPHYLPEIKRQIEMVNKEKRLQRQRAGL